jgi:uncharacterized coiled-coil protein SlyX
VSEELYSQQKEIKTLKQEILNLNKRINELNDGSDANIITDNKKPPHY